MSNYEFQENFSVGAVRNLCALSKHLSGQDINYNDKTISWDGNIIYFSGKKGIKIGKEYSIPVQIKGKRVKQFDDTATFRIDKNDLDNYFNNKGVVFFLVEILDDGVSKIYAKLLLQVDIIQLLSNNKNKKTVLVKMEGIQNYKELEGMCSIYINNANKQSVLIDNPNIFENIGNFLDSSDKPVSFNVSLSNDLENYRPEIAMLRSKYAYFYLNKNGVKIPMNIDFKSIKVKNETITRFCIPNTYEDDLIVEYVYSRDATEIIIQKIFRFHIESKDKRMSLHIINGRDFEFNIVYKASQFILNFLEFKGMLIGDELLIEDESAYSEIKNYFNKPEFVEYHKLIVSLGGMLEELNISKDYFITGDLLDDSKRLYELYDLLTLKLYLNVNDKSRDMQIGKFKVAKQIFFLQANKNSNGKYEAIDLYGSKWNLLVNNDEDLNYKISSNWLYIEPEYIPNSLIDREKMIKELSEDTKLGDDPMFGRLTEYILALVNNYDKSHRRRNIEFAGRLLNIVKKCSGETDDVIINYLQIKKRISKLDDIDKEKLLVLKNGTNSIAVCCACILLEQWDMYRKIYMDLEVGEKEDFCSWPIYNLIPKEVTKTS